MDTGKEQSITITANDRMSDAEIEQAMRDAQQYAGVDSLRRESILKTDIVRSMNVKLKHL